MGDDNPIKTTKTLPHTPDSDTSRATAESMVSKAANQREAIWNLMDAAGDEGVTFDECKVALGYTGDKPRMKELERLGRVRKTSFIRLTRSKRPAAVYVTVPRELWPEPRDGWPCPVTPKNQRGKIVEENARLWRALSIFSDNRRGPGMCPWCYWHGVHEGEEYDKWIGELKAGKRCIVEAINAHERKVPLHE
jgi:hypothetical protein